jgi:glycosyltransferase involved in cell wall biosynthesis
MAGSKLFRTVSKVDLPESITSRVWDTLSHITPISRQRGMRGMLLDMDHRKKIMMEAMALPDLVISPSKIVQKMFIQHISRPVNFLPHGHELSWLNEYHGKTQSDVIRFGYLGGLHEVKGVHLLIEAFKTANLGERARLDIWGTPATNKAYSQKLLSLIGDHPYINLHGAYTRDRLGPILSEIDVAVVPSIWYENAPLVIQEAFATGTPVIATNLGGMAESVVHGINGLLFERNDVVDLVRQLRRVIEEPGLLQKLSSGAPKVKSFDEELVELERIYDQLARENAGAVR